jgi:hypothetical protein
MKKAIIAVLTGIATLGYGATAFAGEGGVAGAAAFTIDIDTGAVIGVAVAAAVGQQNAGAFAHQGGDPIPNVAGALGSNGEIFHTINANGFVASQRIVTETGTLTPNENTFNTADLAVIYLGTGSGDYVSSGTALSPAPVPVP